MKGRSIGAKLVLGIALAVTAPYLRAQDGLKGALPRANLATPFGGSLALADFDNDNQADAAVLVDSGRFRGQSSFRIELHFSGRANTALTFESSETGHTVVARDIDNDNDTDVIVERPFSQGGLYVWLNDGHGGFHKGRIEDFPSAAAPSRGRLAPPPRPLDRPALSLLPQRGSETAIPTARHLPRRSSSSGGFERFAIASAPVLRGLGHNPSRAPPPPHSL